MEYRVLIQAQWRFTWRGLLRLLWGRGIETTIVVYIDRPVRFVRDPEWYAGVPGFPSPQPPVWPVCPEPPPLDQEDVVAINATGSQDPS